MTSQRKTSSEVVSWFKANKKIPKNVSNLFKSSLCE